MNTLWLASISALALLAACGDNTRANGPGPDAAGPGASADSGASADAGSGSASRPHNLAVVVAGDFGPGDPGVLSVVDMTKNALTSQHAPAGAVGDDPQLRHFGDELFIVNRADGNNVTILDDTQFTFKEQLSTGAGTNPQDVALVGNKLYVPTLSTSGVTVLTRGTTTVAQIDLSADDPDGKPDCASAIAVGTDVYVACGLLDENFSPRGPGKVYVIDATTDTVRTAAAVTLSHDNPIGFLEQIPTGAPNAGDLVVPTNNFDDGTGCLEHVVPGATPSNAGCIVDNTALATGYISRVAFEVTATEALAWFAIPTTFPMGVLRSYNLATSTLGAPISGSAQINDVVACPTGTMVTSDTTKNTNGLRIYSDTAEVTTAPLAVGLVPDATHGLVCY